MTAARLVVCIAAAALATVPAWGALCGLWVAWGLWCYADYLEVIR